jgi:transcriptional regulator with XRE-family HTH domain
MTTPVLAAELRAIAPTSAALAEIADRAGVGRRQALLARAGKPIGAGAHLALCGAIGIDPMDGAPCPSRTVPPHIAWWLVAAALFITRTSRRLDQRRAAQITGMSAATVCRLEAGKPVNIVNLVKACRFIGVHADGYAVPLPSFIAEARGPVPQETTTETYCSGVEICHDAAAT